MAELMLKVNAGSGYEDGDILCAFSDFRISLMHASHICSVKAAPRRANGLLLEGTLCQDWHEECHRWRFERVSATEVDRVDLSTSQRERLGNPQIDVESYVRRRRAAGTKLFGADGAEVWYGGERGLDSVALTRMWGRIQSQTSHRRNAPEFSRWPLGMRESRSHLAISVNDMSEAEAEELQSSEVDGAGEVIRRRKHAVDWRTSLGLSQADVDAILDHNIPTDHRGVARQRSQIVRRKP